MVLMKKIEIMKLSKILGTNLSYQAFICFTGHEPYVYNIKKLEYLNFALSGNISLCRN